MESLRSSSPSKMLPISIGPATLALAVSFLLVAYLTNRCWTPPNPSPLGPAASLPRDDLGVSPRAIKTRRLVDLVFWVLHTLFTVYYPFPPVMLCPCPENLSSSLFTWSPYTAFVLASILMAAPIRLLAFKQLGENFTFRLAKPKRLVKTGLYAYVQHPSYPTDWVVLTSNIAMLLRPDGVLGCVLPSRWVSVGVKMWPVLLLLSGALGLGAIWVRVQNEEAMLKDHFESEWEEYSQRTKRFVPGLF